MTGGYYCTERWWIRWNAASTTATSGDYTWGQWSDSTAASTTTSGTYSPDAWVQWSNGQVGKVVYGKPPTVTPKQLAANKKREAELQEQARKLQEERQAAQLRAAELLAESLTEDQRKSMEDTKHFAVIGSDGERYEIDCTRRQHNIFQVDKNGRRVREFCIGQRGDTPLADNHLAQKLLLEADAELFKKTANKWDLVPSRKAVAC